MLYSEKELDLTACLLLCLWRECAYRVLDGGEYNFIRSYQHEGLNDSTFIQDHFGGCVKIYLLF